jgi:hypothetical protein
MEILIGLGLANLLLTCLLVILFIKHTHHPPYFGIASPSDIVLGSTLRFINLPLTQVRLSTHEQKYHAAIFGRSGSGKSKLLQGVFLQHVFKKHGVGVLEPHHDLSFDCLTSLVASGFYKREGAYKRVIYIDWANGSYVPFNILKSKAEPHTIAANILDAFHRVWPALGEGAAPAFDNIIKRGIRVLLANDLPLTKLERLVIDHAWRAELLKKVTDDGVLTYWNTFFDQLNDNNKMDEIKSTLRRLSLLTDNPLLKLTLGQPENALDFRQIMDQGKAIIINLGNVGDQESRKLIGALLMIQIEQAALSRTDLLPNERTPFTLLVDEWPAFAAQQDTISHILSQCRKFNLRLYLAAQSLSQVDSSRLVGALENCKLQIAFGLGRDSAETQARHIGDVDPFLIKEEQLTEHQHNAFMAVNEQFESWTSELQNLKPRQAYIKLEGRHAVKVRTQSIREPRLKSEELGEVLSTYKSLYQRTQEEAEKAAASFNVSPKVSNQTSAPAYTQVYTSKEVLI